MKTWPDIKEAARHLWQRYASVWRHAWSIRHELDAPPRLKHELAFLPAHLELAETPVHPAPGWTMRGIAAFSILVLLVALLGKLDIVVSARGKLIPDARVKIVQPAISGVVREILVRDGQRVAAGQVLIRLDTRQAAADVDKARSAKLDAELAAARARALLAAQRTNGTPQLEPVPGASTDEQQQAQHLAQGTYQEYQDKRASATAALAKREGELAVTRRIIERFTATAPLARRRADDKKALVAEQYVARTDYLEAEQAALEQEHELAAKRSQVVELSAAVDEQRANLRLLASQFQREQLDALDKATQQFTQSHNESTKAQTREQLLSLPAPVAGTVQQLVVHTLGGVVTAAQTLMVIVPDDALEVQAEIENKDMGFLSVGQHVVVKVDAFPYTRYGYLDGEVVSLSNDSTPNRKAGLAYTARIHLSSHRMKIDRQWITLTPGMEVSVEVRTGERRVIGYFLEPLIAGVQGSLHER